MKFLILFVLLIGTAYANGLYLTPLTPQDLRGMCEIYPDACKSAPPVVDPPKPIVALRSRTTCIDGDLYYEVITPANDHIWKLVTDIHGTATKCKQK